MLPSDPHRLRTALNRVTFGARDVDVANVDSLGWENWVEGQLTPPEGDEPDLAAYIQTQTMPIKYAAADEAMFPDGTWDAVNEDRPLYYLDASTEDLWFVATQAGKSISFTERFRVQQELGAATWIRNTHAQYQLRESMTDFWHNHFNIGKVENQLATTLLPVFDRDVIRPNVFGNFRTLLEATAQSTSMLLYLDNASNNALAPNENYAREIMELHTLGGDAYRGVGGDAPVEKGADGVAIGFTDQDVIEAAKALSGWTIEVGQRLGGTSLPFSGKFIFLQAQHSTAATEVLGIDISGFEGISQAQKFLDIIAAHPATATFICTKLCRRIFGDNPPEAVVERAATTWLDNTNEPDQIARVLKSIILDGEEIFTEPRTKIRRPYERIIAMARGIGSSVSAATYMTGALDPLNDGLFAWQAPNGRPDNNGYWLATGATLSTWNFLIAVPYIAEFTT